MGKRNRVRRQSIRELPLIAGPLPLPDLPSPDGAGRGAAKGGAAVPHADESLPIMPDGAVGEGVDARALAPVDGERLRG